MAVCQNFWFCNDFFWGTHFGTLTMAKPLESIWDILALILRRKEVLSTSIVDKHGLDQRYPLCAKCASENLYACIVQYCFTEQHDTVSYFIKLQILYGRVSKVLYINPVSIYIFAIPPMFVWISCLSDFVSFWASFITLWSVFAKVNIKTI